jgi:hypothetical protein
MFARQDLPARFTLNGPAYWNPHPKDGVDAALGAEGVGAGLLIRVMVSTMEE